MVSSLCAQSEGITTDITLTSPSHRCPICKFIRTNDGNVVEALASGIPAALAALRDAGMPDLDFYDQGITFTVTIRRQTAPRPPSPTGLSRRIGTQQSELLKLLTTPKTVGELAEQLAISFNAVRKRLTSLRSAGLVIQHGGPGRHTTYERSP